MKSYDHSHRIWEIDFIRGIAILLMILFHLIVDLKDFYGYHLEYLSGYWYIEGKCSAILFMLICGVSSTLGQRSTRHGFQVFMWALCLTGVTYLYNENFYIRFGILHFLGISLLLSNFIRGLSIECLLLLSSLTMMVGVFFSESIITSPYLFPLGLRASTFVSMDYYPLFPWFGVFTLGILMGKWFYSKANLIGLHHRSRIKPQRLNHIRTVPILNLIVSLGQHSLLVYLIHQPILLALLYLIHR